jgi:hypothetical protein
VKRQLGFERAIGALLKADRREASELDPQAVWTACSHR